MELPPSTTATFSTTFPRLLLPATAAAMAALSTTFSMHGHHHLVDEPPLLIGSWIVLPSTVVFEGSSCKDRLQMELRTVSAAVKDGAVSWIDGATSLRAARDAPRLASCLDRAAVSSPLELRIIYCSNGLLYAWLRAGKLSLCRLPFVLHAWAIFFLQTPRVYDCSVTVERPDALWESARWEEKRISCNVVEDSLILNKRDCTLYQYTVCSAFSVIIIIVGCCATVYSACQVFRVDNTLQQRSCALEGWHATPSLGFSAFAGVRAEEKKPELLCKVVLTVAAGSFILVAVLKFVIKGSIILCGYISRGVLISALVDSLLRVDSSFACVLGSGREGFHVLQFEV